MQIKQISYMCYCQDPAQPCFGEKSRLLLKCLLMYLLFKKTVVVHSEGKEKINTKNGSRSDLAQTKNSMFHTNG